MESPANKKKTAEDEAPKDRGWRTWVVPSWTWKKKTKGKIFHINITWKK
jgi:hypothetical protein